MDIWLQAAIYLATMCLGFLLKRVGIFKGRTAASLQAFIFYATLPALVVSSYAGVEVTLWFMVAFSLGIFSNLFNLAAGALASRGRKPQERAIYFINTPGFNLGGIAIPFLQSFYPAGVPYLCMFDTADSFFTMGTTYSIAKLLFGQKKGILAQLREICRSLLSSVPFIAYLFMTIISLLHLSLPTPVMELAGFVGKANAPLVMLMLGVSFELQIKKEDLKDILSILGLRLACSVALFIFILYFLPGPALMKQVLAVCVFAPIPNLCMIYSHKIDSNSSVASTLNPVAIILSIIFMSVAMSLV